MYVHINCRQSINIRRSVNILSHCCIFHSCFLYFDFVRSLLHIHDQKYNETGIQQEHTMYDSRDSVSLLASFLPMSIVLSKCSISDSTNAIYKQPLQINLTNVDCMFPTLSRPVILAYQFG